MIILPVDMSKTAGGEADTVDPDHIPCTVASDLGLYWLIWSVCILRVNTVY